MRCFILALPVFLLCTGTAPGASNWQWIDCGRVERMTREGSSFLLIDVRSRTAFEGAHAEGAINIPAQDLGLKTFPRQRMLVLIDEALGQKDAREAADKLAGKGQERVFVLAGGLPEWKRQGLSVVETTSTVRGVTTYDFAWAQAAGVALKVYDLRDAAERKLGTVQSSESVEGATLEDRLTQLHDTLIRDDTAGLWVRLKPSTPVVLVFAASDDADEHTRRVLRGVRRDVRYLIGGYESTLSDSKRGRQLMGAACPTCPGKGK
jgi:rhodanese-related sulfurtransferase